MNATLGKLSLSTSNGQATCPRPWAEVLRWAAAGAATMGPATAGTGSAAPALSCANSCGLGVGAIVKAKLGLQPNRSTRRILGRSATKPASWLTPSSGRS